MLDSDLLLIINWFIILYIKLDFINLHFPQKQREKYHYHRMRMVMQVKEIVAVP